MRSDREADDVTTPPRGLSRRTLVKGAAWSVPVVAVAVAAPVAAASVPCAGAGSKTFRAPSSSSPRSVPFTVPAGVTELSFVVTGGAGGSVKGDTANQVGGQGGRVTGTISVTPGEVLDIYVGQGGTGTTSGSTGPEQRAGGRGYGDGGSAGAPPGDQSPSYVKWNCGAGGGGGSAIVRGSSPLVVAGGGGGGSGDFIVGNNISIGARPRGGDAGASGGSWGFGSTNGQKASAYGGSSGATGRGGTGGTYSGPWPQPPTFKPGGAGSGRNGGTSYGGGVAVLSSPPDGWSTSGGGGGGGYGGGGGGETMWGFTDTHSGAALIGGGGGGGTSYVAPGTSATIGLSGVTADPAGRADGSVVLSWTCP
ncbi:hypothetical protein LK09_00465 [Microbacterium mangrovi]|uniref:Glycine rich protein n=1 Tax=Microbacterium mangrovi TaxID=1348253 RepID=A0A0B2ADU0_9MICO|nr:hypothetical protein [Microbacterium mangrovi]KHK99850.1 hypothetical protein LK09_00465 [Microbacterium mangrovi]